MKISLQISTTAKENPYLEYQQRFTWERVRRLRSETSRIKLNKRLTKALRYSYHVNWVILYMCWDWNNSTKLLSRKWQWYVLQLRTYPEGEDTSANIGYLAISVSFMNSTSFWSTIESFIAIITQTPAWRKKNVHLMWSHEDLVTKLMDYTSRMHEITK